MGIWFNKRGEEYYGETEKSWWKSYIDRLFNEHKEKKPIDHPDGSVTEEKLASGSVTEVKIANNSVTDNKIGFREVKYPIKGTTLKAGLTAHLSNLISEVDTANNNHKLHREADVLDHPDGSVTKEKLASGSVTTAKLGSGSVTEEKLANNSVTDEKIGERQIQYSAVVSEVLPATITNHLQFLAEDMGTVSNNVNNNKAEFDSHTSNKNNPHAVTKAQVELGNVPNVTTNNQTPTYTEAATLTNITSGETLSTTFGKIKKAIANYIIHKQEIPEDGHRGHVHLSDNPTYAGLSDNSTAASAYCANLIHKNIENHKTDTDNPHSVTKEQVGLGNVDNTSDLNKPISTAMRTALDGKLNVIQYSDKDLNEITRDGVYRLIYSNMDFDKSLYNLPDGYEITDVHLDFGLHDMYLIVTSTNLTDSAPEDATNAYYGIQFLYTKDGLFIRTIEKHAQTNGSYYFNSWYNTEADIENHKTNTSNPHSVTKEQVGLGNVENKSSATIRSEITKENVTTALGYTPTEANIKKNPNATDGDIIDTHLTVGVREGKAGNYSFVSGGDGAYENEASGVSSAAVGGMDNHATGLCTFVGGGIINKASGSDSAVVGGSDNTASGNGSAVVGGSGNTALAYQLKTGHYSKDGIAGASSGTTGDAFIVGNGTYESASNAFRVAYDGNCYAATAMNSTGADYAECFEWTDGNPDNEDRIGFMTAFEGTKIRLANENDPVEIIGVVSALPAVVGDNYADEWCGKYLKDKYGRLITEHKVYEAETDENGNIIREAYEADEYVLNPDYNADEEYIPRLKRKEYSAVGTHGKLAVRDDGSCEVGGFCRSGNGGIATKSDSGFYVMERIDDETVRIYIK